MFMQGEKRELLRDSLMLVIYLTPISSAVSVGSFVHKWVVKKKGVKRAATQIEKKVIKKRAVDKIKGYRKRDQPRIRPPDRILFQ